MKPFFVLLGIVTMTLMNTVAFSAEREATPAVVDPAIRSPHREFISLDGVWDFAVDPKNIGEQQKWQLPATPLPEKRTIEVPGCWEAQGVGGPGDSRSVTPEQSIRPLRGSYVGTAWYKKEANIPAAFAGKRIWLAIGGVNAQGWFYVNGEYVGHLACYCGTYKYDITDLVQPGEKAVVAVKVRNDLPSGKGLMNWIHRFGGLYRSVEIDATPAVALDDVYVSGDLDQQKAAVHVTLRIAEPLPKDIRAWEIAVKLSTRDGTAAGEAVASFKSSGKSTEEITLTSALDPFHAWSPEHPNLYRAEVVLRADGKPVDGWCERFGVRKWEVRGGSFYLNNQKYFVRGYGDDFIYPLTIISPPSREEHRKHLQLAKSYGFAYVRHHTHCEVPEFYEAADELGIMIQPELPYYGATPSAADAAFFRPKEDLAELYRHYRRYVSLATYCTGNEGHTGSPLDAELYRLGKQLDPTRLMLHQDGGANTPENSDFGSGPIVPWPPGNQNGSRPFTAHEYLNLATDEDPRLEKKYRGALKPPVSAAAFEQELKRNGLSAFWGVACLDAGNRLKRDYQKRGLEQARLDPDCDGYIFWTIVDVGNPSAQGLFNQFWEPKATQPSDLLGCNGPTAILLKMTPDTPVFCSEETRKVEWWISHFDAQPLSGKTLRWKLSIEGKAVATGSLEHVEAQPGDVKKIGEAIITLPKVAQPCAARLTVEIEGTKISNAWNWWIFPPVEPNAEAGKKLAATKSVFESLEKRYPGIALAGTPEADNRKVFLTDRLDENAFAALDQWKTVMLLSLDGPQPGASLGWWTLGNQRGTAIKKHPAFGDFPQEGYLSPLFFRLVKSTALLNKPEFRGVEPLMVGHGTDGYLAYVFQAGAGRGKLFATGLDVLADYPEAQCLLDQFIAYVSSDRFQPQSNWDSEHWKVAHGGK